MQFAIAAGGGRGAHSFAVGQQLWAFGQAEFEDARLLVSTIVALGGEPVTEVADLAFTPEIDDTLTLLIRTEEETLTALHAVIPDTGQEPRSEALEHLLEHLIMRKQNQVDVLIRARG